jgi:hypothetical protein
MKHTTSRVGRDRSEVLTRATMQRAMCNSTTVIHNCEAATPEPEPECEEAEECRGFGSDTGATELGKDILKNRCAAHSINLSYSTIQHAVQLRVDRVRYFKDLGKLPWTEKGDDVGQILAASQPPPAARTR